MIDRLNKTLIASVVYIDLIGYSKKPVAEQLSCKANLNRRILEAVQEIAEQDRIIVDTGDGVAITLLDMPENALRISLAIRESVPKDVLASEKACHVRIGINLGPVLIIKDINGHYNVVGDGINTAQRIMSFARPDQILVSRSFQEIASRLTDEIKDMLVFAGVKHDKHVRGHEVFAVRARKLPPRRATSSYLKWLGGACAIMASMAVFAFIQKEATSATNRPLSSEMRQLEASPVPPAQAKGPANFSGDTPRNPQPSLPKADQKQHSHISDEKPQAGHEQMVVHREDWSPASETPRPSSLVHDELVADRIVVPSNTHAPTPTCSDAQRSLKQC